MPINPITSQGFAPALTRDNCLTTTDAKKVFQQNHELGHFKNFILEIKNSKPQPCQNDYPLQVFIIQALFATIWKGFFTEDADVADQTRKIHINYFIRPKAKTPQQ